jgi:hypothetical protein
VLLTIINYYQGDEMIEKYKHCSITNNDEKIYKHDPVSGAYWSESIPRQGFYVTGGKLGNRSFKKIETAKDWIDFDYELQFGKFKQID